MTPGAACAGFMLQARGSLRWDQHPHPFSTDSNVFTDAHDPDAAAGMNCCSVVTQLFRRRPTAKPVDKLLSDKAEPANTLLS